MGHKRCHDGDDMSSLCCSEYIVDVLKEADEDDDFKFDDDLKEFDLFNDSGSFDDDDDDDF